MPSRLDFVLKEAQHQVEYEENSIIPTKIYARLQYIPLDRLNHILDTFHKSSQYFAHWIQRTMEELGNV